MLHSRITLLHWIKIPSIVFDQGASAVWGEDRLAAEKLFPGEENFLFLENFSNKSLQEFKPYDSDLDFLSAFHDPLFGVNTSLRDFEMHTPDRTRKCSISDIIDVINDDKLFLQSTITKDEGYDSGNTYSASSPSAVSSDDSFSSEDLSLGEEKDPSQINVFSKDEDYQIIETTQYVAMKDLLSSTSHFSNEPCSSKMSTPLKEENLKITLNSASALLNSEDDAVIIVMDKSKQVQYVSTSREKLQSFLNPEDPVINDLTISQQKENAKEPLTQSKKNSAENPTANVKGRRGKRGRKCIYTCSNEEEKEDSKRVRNNVACRKFRKVKTMKLKDLFETESKLLQHNLNLKEEIAALQRQLAYMREKLGEEGIKH